MAKTKCKYWVRWPRSNGQWVTLESTSKKQVELLAKVLKEASGEPADMYRKCGRRVDSPSTNPDARW